MTRTDPIMRDRARRLRCDSTPQERTLWSKLRNSQYGVRFRRQQPFGPYILDFYCAAHGLVIEVDGSQHIDASVYDEKRSTYLEQHGLRVLRFTNTEINTNMKGVVLSINDALVSSPQPSP